MKTNLVVMFSVIFLLLSGVVYADPGELYPHVKAFPGDPTSPATTGTAVPLDSSIVFMLLSGATVALHFLHGSRKGKSKEK